MYLSRLVKTFIEVLCLLNSRFLYLPHFIYSLKIKTPFQVGIDRKGIETERNKII